MRAAVAAAWSTVESGDPASARPALLKIVDAPNPPLRVFFGTPPLRMAPAVCTDRLKTWQERAEVSTQAQGAAA